MTDKKFTDEEIIQSLQEMWDCSYNYEECQQHLINRQKAEIERLKECPKCVYEYDGEITEYCVQGPCQNFKTVEQIKAEAYKEFAEKFKKELLTYRKKCRNALDNESAFVVDKVRQMIDNLLKEMVGEK